MFFLFCAACIGCNGLFRILFAHLGLVRIDKELDGRISTLPYERISILDVCVRSGNKRSTKQG